MSSGREKRALARLEQAGIDLDNSKPDDGPRRWFAGPFQPVIEGLDQLELVAHFAAIAHEAGRRAPATHETHEMVDGMCLGCGTDQAAPAAREECPA